MSGLMSLTGMPVGQPLGTASSIVDRYTSLHATIGMLAALHHRDRTGEGQEVDVCLMDSGLTMVEIPTSYYLATGQEGGEGGRPPYKAKDGHVVISASGREMGSRLLQIATGDANAVANTGAFTGRMGLDDSPRKKVEAWCLEHTVDEIVAALVKADVPVAPVKREMLVKMEDPLAGEMYLPGATIKMSKTPGRIGPVPTPGQHTDEVLSRLLSYDRATLDELRQAKIIA
jgi:crotonobetainyl-CoA:carnitine CoA-transferase CaiB-like acyl-CoA transferase